MESLGLILSIKLSGIIFAPVALAIEIFEVGLGFSWSWEMLPAEGKGVCIAELLQIVPQLWYDVCTTIVVVGF